MNRTDGVVVVTGAGAGVGRAVVREFARRGYRVASIGRQGRRLEEARCDVLRFGADGIAIEADVADSAEVERAAARVEEELGPIAIWVNNAMVSIFAPFPEISAKEFQRVTEVNYLGYVHGTRAALDRMLPRDKGVIVQVGSALAYRAVPFQSAYSGSKHAIRGFTQSVRCELLERRSAVRIGMVQLPALNTPHFEWVRSRLPRCPRPVAPVYQPEVAARAVVSMAERPRRELWVGWSTARAIVATMVAPGLLDRYLGRVGARVQQTDEPAEPDRADNLFQPVERNVGAHGRFDGARTKERALSFGR